MGYISVNEIEKTTVGQNLMYPGAMFLKRKGDYLYAHIEDKCYRFSEKEYIEDDKFKSIIYAYKEETRNVPGKFIAFKLKIRGCDAQHIIIVSPEHIPIMVYQEIVLGVDENGCKIKNVSFCYNPKLNAEKQIYTGSIGEINLDLYEIASNKSRLLNSNIPKVDYVKKAKLLKTKIEKDLNVPLRYELSHKDISIEGINPNEMNKLHLLSKLDNMIENYGNSTIYYSNSLKRVENKYKMSKKYFSNSELFEIA